MEPGALALKLADEGADSLAQIEDRAEKETNAALQAALLALLLALRRPYARYAEAIRNPGSVSPAELASRYQDVIRAAQRFLSPAEISAWENRYRINLEAAMAAAAITAEQLHRVEAPEDAPPPYAGPDPVEVDQQLQQASLSLRSEASGFRDQLVLIVSAAATQGWGIRRVGQQARRAMQGISSRRGSSLRPQTGVVQRVAVAIRSNLQEAAGRLSTRFATAAGFEYVRWIATRDERTCAYCVARHGRIYRVGTVSVPAHRRCRCWLQPVSSDGVNNPDPVAADQQLGGPFWRQSQQRIWREYAASRGKSLQEARPEILRAANTPTAAEKRRFPGVQSSTPPAKTLDGPGGRDLGTAVRDANRKDQPET